MQQRNKLPMLAVLYAAAFVSAFNENIVNVALVDIMGEFAIGALEAQWLVTGYMAVTAVVVACMAFLMRRFSTRALFFTAAACFVVAEAACIVAPTFPALLAARLVQAIGSGMFTPLMMSAVLACAPRGKIGTYLSIGSACITLGPAFAPVCSGLVVTMFGWRMVFAAPAVVVLLTAIAGMKFVSNIGAKTDAHLDAASLALAFIGLPLFVFGLGEVPVDVLVGGVALAGGIGLIALFVWRQARTDNPLLNIAPLMRNRSFASACVLVIVAMMTTFSMGILLPLFFESSFGFNALVAGALTLPAIVVNAATAVAGGRVMDRRGAWPLLPVGFGAIVAGLVFLTLSAPDLGLGITIAASIAVYAGVGLVMAPSQTAGLGALRRSQHDDGVSAMNTLIMVAASFGPSFFVGVMSSDAGAAQAAGAVEAIAQAQGFASACSVATFIALAGFVVAFVFSLRTREKKLAPVVLRTMELSAEDRPAPTLESVMHADAYTVDSRATVRDVARILVGTKTSGVPIVDGERRLVGFVSDGDIMRAISGMRPDGFDVGRYVMRSIDGAYDSDEAFASMADELMSMPALSIAERHVVAIEKDTPLDEAFTLLRSSRFKKVPVMSGDKLVGTVSRNDVVRYLMGVLAE